jgi:hypothetical protein
MPVQGSKAEDEFFLVRPLPAPSNAYSQSVIKYPFPHVLTFSSIKMRICFLLLNGIEKGFNKAQLSAIEIILCAENP